MDIVSTIMRPTFELIISFSFSNICFCSSNVVGFRNIMLLSIFSYFGVICFRRVIENPPSVSMNIAFFPFFAVSIAARSIRFVFPLPAGPYIVVIASFSYPPSRSLSITIVPLGIFSMQYMFFLLFIYFVPLKLQYFRPKSI